MEGGLLGVEEEPLHREEVVELRDLAEVEEEGVLLHFRRS